MFWAKSNDQTHCWFSKWLPNNHCCWCTIEVKARAACQCLSPWSTISPGRRLGDQEHWGGQELWLVAIVTMILIGCNKANPRWLCQGGRCLIGMWDQTWLRFATGPVLLRLAFKLHFVFHLHQNRKSQYYVGRVWFVKIQRWVRLKWWSWGLVQAVDE